MKLLDFNNASVNTAFTLSKSQNRESNQVKQENDKSMRVMSNVLCDKNYGILQTKKMNVSFTGPIVKAPLNSVSKKVNNLFNIVRSNDLIVTTPSLDEGVKSLRENVDNIKTVIKRVFFVEDKNMDRTIGFRKNLERKEALNFSDKPLMIKDSKNQSGFVEKGGCGYLVDGDRVNSTGYEIHINEQAETILPVKDSFSFFVDLDKEVEPKIRDINEKSLSAMVADKKTDNKPKKIMFSDVGGMDKTIKELKQTIVFPIKYPEIKNGKNMRNTVLLYGPPGTGKSFISEACANEAGAWYKKINASQLDSKWVGESEENWRNLFAEARKNQPALIFIDEVDAIAKKRGGADVHGDKTLNTILGLMSDSEKNGDQIYMVAATNKRELLDDAFTRSGRFGYAIEAPAPDLKGTGEILDKYIANEPVNKDLDRGVIAEKLYKEKATGSDIAAFAEDARKAAMNREQIYEKMDNGTYTPKDLENLTINEEDFDKALEVLKSNKQTKQRRPIGFNSELYK